MDCIEKKKLSAYLDGELAGEERARVRAHLDECAACRAEAEELAAVSDALDAVEEIDTDPYFAARVKRLATAQKQRGRFGALVIPAAATAAATSVSLLAGGLLGQALYAGWAAETTEEGTATIDSLYSAYVEAYPEGSLSEFLDEFPTNGGNL